MQYLQRISILDTFYLKLQPTTLHDFQYICQIFVSAYASIKMCCRKIAFRTYIKIVPTAEHLQCFAEFCFVKNKFIIFPGDIWTDINFLFVEPLFITHALLSGLQE